MKRTLISAIACAVAILLVWWLVVSIRDLVYGTAPGCYWWTGRDGLMSTAGSMAKETGGGAAVFDNGPCNDRTAADVYIPYPGISDAAIADRFDGLSYCERARLPSQWNCILKGSTVFVEVYGNMAYVELAR
jgi:hypothetical protein